MSDPVRFHISLNVSDLAKSVAFFPPPAWFQTGEPARRVREVRPVQPATGAVARTGQSRGARRRAQSRRLPPAGCEDPRRDATALGTGGNADQARRRRRVLLR